MGFLSPCMHMHSDGKITQRHMHVAREQHMSVGVLACHIVVTIYTVTLGMSPAFCNPQCAYQ